MSVFHLRHGAAVKLVDDRTYHDLSIPGSSRPSPDVCRRFSLPLLEVDIFARYSRAEYDEERRVLLNKERQELKIIEMNVI